MTYEEAYARVKRIRDEWKWLSNKSIATLLMLVQAETEKRFEPDMVELHEWRESDAVARSGVLDRVMAEPYDPQLITDPASTEKESA